MEWRAQPAGLRIGADGATAEPCAGRGGHSRSTTRLARTTKRAERRRVPRIMGRSRVKTDWTASQMRPDFFNAA
jgi:hypothetical protein